MRVGCRQRMGWLIDRGGVEARVWDEEGGAPRWKLALFDRPPVQGTGYFDELRVHWPVWPAPASHTLAREMLISKVGGLPHGGFVMPTGFRRPIMAPLAVWRAANPGALVNNVHFRAELTDADFVHLAGTKALMMDNCFGPGLTDAAFVHLRGLHMLSMLNCNQESITDATFAHLRGLHTLVMGGCNQSTITDAAFTHLRGIQVLNLYNCNQASITGATFAHLRGVRSLYMGGCSPAAIAAARALGLPVVA